MTRAIALDAFGKAGVGGAAAAKAVRGGARDHQAPPPRPLQHARTPRIGAA